MKMTPKQFGIFIVGWFAEHKRELPWRVPEVQRDAYKVWISEVMLQQTQAPRVIGFFEKFMGRFPSVESLSQASWEEVLEYVRGLGYYRRFRNLIRGAEIVMRDFDGKFPHTYENLRKLPGIGEYTANAILAFSFGEDVVAMDTNVRQVLKHFFGELSDDELKKIAAKACPRGSAREFYQAMMDYAAAELRQHRAIKRVTKIREVKNPSAIKVAIGLVIRGKEILIQRVIRENNAHPIYEFPGGTLEAGESERICLKRELFEEVGIEAAVRPPFLRTTHSYGEKEILLSWHRCSILAGEPFGKEGQEVMWVPISSLPNFSFPPSNDEVIRALS